jgi:hypothetical protein
MDANKLLQEIDKLEIVTTDKGRYISVDSLKKLMAESAQEKLEEVATPKPKNFHEAKAAVRQDEELMQQFPSGPLIPESPTAARA